MSALWEYIKSKISSVLGLTSTNYGGTAAAASKLSTSRTISLTGSATGSGSFDGSGNLSISTSISEATQSKAGLLSASDKSKLDGIAESANNYTLPTASSTLGGVKTTSAVTSTSGLTATPIIDGIPYYKDTNTTYSAATTSANGLMSASDKKKLDNSGETVYYIAGPSTDTVGVWTGTESRITEYYNGLTVLYVPAVAGSSSTTLNINDLGAKTCYYNGTKKITTQYTTGAPILLTYIDDAWKRADYYDDVMAMRVYRQTVGANTDLPLLVSRTVASSIGTVGKNESYTPVHGVIWNDASLVPTLNPATGEIKAKTVTAKTLAASSAEHLTSAASKICVLDSSGVVQYRTADELGDDVGVSTALSQAMSAEDTANTAKDTADEAEATAEHAYNAAANAQATAILATSKTYTLTVNASDWVATVDSGSTVAYYICEVPCSGMTSSVQLSCIELVDSYKTNSAAVTAFRTWSYLETGTDYVAFYSDEQPTTTFAVTAI